MRSTRIALATFICLTCLAALVPASASAFQKAIWGPPYRHGKNEFALYHQMGVTLYETNIDWVTVAPKKPTHAVKPSDRAYRWPTYLTQELRLAAKYKMHVMIQVKGSPAWANGGHKTGAGVLGDEWAPTNASAYASFVEAVAKKYPSVHLWMIWGEPDRAGSFEPLKAVEDPNYHNSTTAIPSEDVSLDHRYAAMVNDSYDVLKRLSKRNLVIGGNTWSNGIVDEKQWIANMKLPDGKRPKLSMWGHNPFGIVAPEFLSSQQQTQQIGAEGGAVQFSDLPTLEGWTKKYFGHSLPLFLSEYNVETELDDTFSFQFLQTEQTATDWTKEALQSSRRTKWIYALGWINIYDTSVVHGRRQTGTGLFFSSGKAKPDEASWANYG